MKTIIEALIVGIISMTVIYFLTGCSTKSKKFIMVNCERTNTEVPQGKLDLCERYQ